MQLRFFILGAFFFYSSLGLVWGQGVSVLQTAIQEVFKLHSPAVLRVKAVHTTPSEDPESQEERTSLKVASGFFISADGHILTNATVALGASRVWVEIDDIAYAAEPIGHDPLTNISLLRVLNVPENLHFLSLDGGMSLPTIGTMVTGISCPLEFDPSPTLGMITGREGNFVQRAFPTTYLRVNLPANPGEAGSPVFDLEGKLLGILVASVPEIGASYALPIRALHRIREDLLRYGEVKYAWLGIDIREETSLDEGKQLIITEITEGSPAEDAELKEGDILKSLGEFAVFTVSDVRNATFFSHPEQILECRVIRNGQPIRVNIRVGKRDFPEIPQIRPTAPTVAEKKDTALPGEAESGNDPGDPSGNRME